MCLAFCHNGLKLQLVKWPQIPSPVASEIAAKRFSACVMKGHKVHLHLSLLWCFDVACALSRFISKGDSIKPQISKTHISFVFAGCGAQTPKSRAYFFKTLINWWRKHFYLKQQFGEVTIQTVNCCPECLTPIEMLDFKCFAEGHVIDGSSSLSTLSFIILRSSCCPMEWKDFLNTTLTYFHLITNIIANQAVLIHHS